MTPSILWLLAGVALCAAEVMIGPGIGLFFAGLAAITVAVLADQQLAGATEFVAQLAWFFALTIAWAAALWRPLKKFYSHRGKPSAQFNNIVGDKAIVGAMGLFPGREGTAVWSGTIMKAELEAGVSLPVASGQSVTIVAVRGATLIVK